MRVTLFISASFPATATAENKCRLRSDFMIDLMLGSNSEEEKNPKMPLPSFPCIRRSFLSVRI